MPDARILFIDAYDSFSNNIAALLRDQLQASVTVIKIDDDRFVLNDDAFYAYLGTFDAVVAGPGPGHPAIPKDVGLIAKLWTCPNECTIPVLGICLGFQSLLLAHGASVGRLSEPRHGLVTEVDHCKRDIFAGVGIVQATQYHSLHAFIKGIPKAQSCLYATCRDSSEIVPLAYDLSDALNGPILMAARHCHQPFWGVQFHPESICTNEAGVSIIRNWWDQVVMWNDRARRSPPIRSISTHATSNGASRALNGSVATKFDKVAWSSASVDERIEITTIADLLHSDNEPIILESGTRNGSPVNAETGRFSIIGLPTRTICHSLDACDETITQHKAQGGPPSIPFWGGLVGYISYEAALELIGVDAPVANDALPGVSFVLVERSVVVDHVAHICYVQSIRHGDQDWIDETLSSITALAQTDPCQASKSLPEAVTASILSEPCQADYLERVKTCQEHLRAGSSYELCLTDQTLVRSNQTPRALHDTVRRTNPAPFGAYMQLDMEKGSMHIVGSSPERFLSVSRDGLCQFRPIKGTVKKTGGMTRAKAEAILGSQKERAENLMIVDLIRHDLNTVKNIENVRVPQLMSVEEYETVFQLVSVIEGDLTAKTRPTEVLRASLPPGSMTGAPKKRSCELLREIEGHRPRGLYSGVIGYMDVGGGCDFAVVIRTAVSYSDHPGVWHVGAGGAVTVLSDPQAEWEEMLTKRASVLSAFL